MKTLEEKVMIRVRRIYMLRRFLHPTLLKVYSGSALVVVLASLVSVTNVVANMPALSAPSALTDFVVRALLNTEVFVQLILTGIVVVLGLLIRDIVRGVGKEQHGGFAHP